MTKKGVTVIFGIIGWFMWAAVLAMDARHNNQQAMISDAMVLFLLGKDLLLEFLRLSQPNKQESQF